MSFHERSTAAMLAINVLVYGWFFAWVIGRSPQPDLGDVVGMVTAMLVVIVVLTIVTHIAIARLTLRQRDGSRDRPDERDRLIATRAGSGGGIVLSAGVVCVLGYIIGGASPYQIAQALVGALGLSEIARLAFRLVLYRRG